MLARIHQTAHGNVHRQNIIWSRATTVFAAFQAAAGYGYSAIFNVSGGNHRLLFVIAAIATLLGLAVDYIRPTARPVPVEDGAPA